MVQGDSYNLSVTIKNKGQPLDVASVEKVEISLLYLQKSYPGEIGYEDGKFLFPPHPAGDLSAPEALPDAGAREIQER